MACDAGGHQAGEGLKGKNKAWIITVESSDSGEVFQDRARFVRLVGRRIKEHRLYLGMSRRQLGGRLGVSGQQIEKYENGKDSVPLHRLVILARLCNRSPESFWTDGESGTQDAAGHDTADTMTLELVRAYKRVGDAKQRRRLLQLVKQMAGEEEFTGR